MSVEVFIERSRLGTVFYQLRGVNLEVSGRRAMRSFAVDVELHALTPRVEILSKRFVRPVLLVGVPGLMMLATAVMFMVQRALPVEAVMWFAQISGVTGAVFLAVAIRWFPRLEVVRFKDVVGRTSFDLIREAAQAREVDAFVEVVLARVAEAKLPNQSLEPTRVLGTSAAEPPRVPSTRVAHL